MSKAGFSVLFVNIIFFFKMLNSRNKNDVTLTANRFKDLPMDCRNTENIYGI